MSIWSFLGGFSGSVTLLFSVMLLDVNSLSRSGSNKGLCCVYNGHKLGSPEYKNPDFGGEKKVVLLRSAQKTNLHYDVLHTMPLK